MTNQSNPKQFGLLGSLELGIWILFVICQLELGIFQFNDPTLLSYPIGHF